MLNVQEKVIFTENLKSVADKVFYDFKNHGQHCWIDSEIGIEVVRKLRHTSGGLKN